DVGANVGFHAVFAARLGARVVAVEPVPWTLELLRANVWRHGADVEVVDGAVDVLKVDVEGAEPLVLRGASAILARSPVLAAIVEFRDEPHVGGESPAEVLAFYESLGFELCLLRRNGELEPASAAAV